MNELSPEAHERREKARNIIRRYISLEALHQVFGTYENEDDAVERKND